MLRHFLGSAPSELRESTVTHAGLVRAENQDSFCARTAAGVWAVADGMGGHHGGEEASRAVAAAIATLPEKLCYQERIIAARAAISRANEAIFAAARQNGRQMGTTVVMLVIGEGRYSIMWAGDSRAYLKRGQGITCLTRDHSQAEELIAAGQLDREAAAGHPSSHILVRAIGVTPDVALDQIDGNIEADDVFLLCSDGLHSLVSEVEMAKMIDSQAFDRVSEQLVELGLERGAPDNITISLISVGAQASARKPFFGSFHL
jgi:serine/threonine protein phosphatase Stp1